MEYQTSPFCPFCPSTMRLCPDCAAAYWKALKKTRTPPPRQVCDPNAARIHHTQSTTAGADSPTHCAACGGLLPYHWDGHLGVVN